MRTFKSLSAWHVQNWLQGEDVDADLESGSDDEGTPSPVTRVEYMSAFDTVRRYLYQLGGPDDEVQAMQRLINTLENTAISFSTRNLKQGTLDNYFKKLWLP